MAKTMERFAFSDKSRAVCRCTYALRAFIYFTEQQPYTFSSFKHHHLHLCIYHKLDVLWLNKDNFVHHKDTRYIALTYCDSDISKVCCTFSPGLWHRRVFLTFPVPGLSILLCVFGVANISSIETLPQGIRVASLLYQILIFTCTAPLFFMY